MFSNFSNSFIIIINFNSTWRRNNRISYTIKILFWRALNIPLISCEVSLELKWNKICVITSLERRQVGTRPRNNAPTGATLAINDCKLYVPVVTYLKMMKLNY